MCRALIILVRTTIPKNLNLLLYFLFILLFVFLSRFLTTMINFIFYWSTKWPLSSTHNIHRQTVTYLMHIRCLVFAILKIYYNFLHLFHWRNRLIIKNSSNIFKSGNFFINFSAVRNGRADLWNCISNTVEAT